MANNQDSGTLFLVATPMGNLEDITLRAIRTLESADLIAAEDTRHSLKLLNHLGIKKSMTSYHKHNQKAKESMLIRELENGKNIALITDAGTPAISDPGEDLVRACHERSIPVTICPGCCAAVSALAVSGQKTEAFYFTGFLPRQNRVRRTALNALKGRPETLIIYESPHHLQKTLIDIRDYLCDPEISVVRELTKSHEEIFTGRVSEAITHFAEPLGEFVLVVAGAKSEPDSGAVLAQSAESVATMVADYTKQGMDEKQAMKQVARDLNMGKRDVYRMVKTPDGADSGDFEE